MQKPSQKDLLLELERVCRIICYQKVGSDLESCRKILACVLEELARLRAERENVDKKPKKAKS